MCTEGLFHAVMRALKLTFPISQVRHESRGLPIVHHSKYVCDLPPNHRFPMGKFPRVLRSLLKDQVITEKQVSEALV